MCLRWRKIYNCIKIEDNTLEPGETFSIHFTQDWLDIWGDGSLKWLLLKKGEEERLIF